MNEYVAMDRAVVWKYYSAIDQVESEIFENFSKNILHECIDSTCNDTFRFKIYLFGSIGWHKQRRSSCPTWANLLSVDSAGNSAFVYIHFAWHTRFACTKRMRWFDFSQQDKERYKIITIGLLLQNTPQNKSLC